MAEKLTDAARRETVMDVNVEQIARVYAGAFLGAAKGRGDPDAAVAELQSLVDDVLDQHPEFERLLGSALLTHEDKQGVLDRVLAAQASPEVLSFLKVLSAHGRLGMLRPVVRAVCQLHGTQSGRVEVELTVASDLDDALRDQFVQTLQEKLGREPVLDVRVDTSLLAGFVLKVGDTVYDSSIKTRFEKARRAMIARAIEQIETKPEVFLDD